MVVCPLCEHPQAVGATCEVCGKSLVERGARAEVVAPLAGLESTRLDSIGTAVPEEGAMLQLAGHRAPAVAVEASAPPEVEPTRFAASRAPGPAPIRELEPTRFEDPGPRTPATSAVACRYCGNQQKEGALCDRCGMQLPRAARLLDPDARSEADVRCQVCGVKGVLSTRCRSCGAEILLAAEPHARIP
jgi:hypothetical protein